VWRGDNTTALQGGRLMELLNCVVKSVQCYFGELQSKDVSSNGSMGWTLQIIIIKFMRLTCMPYTTSGLQKEREKLHRKEGFLIYDIKAKARFALPPGGGGVVPSI